MKADARIYVAGSRTFLGRAIVAGLREWNYRRVCGDVRDADLTNRVYIDRTFERIAPEIVVHAGGRSGGIQTNIEVPADLMRDNLLAATNVVDAAYRYGASKVLYLASSCCYPRKSGQPIPESALGAGHLEPTNAAYATAKLAGIGLCAAYHAQYGLACVPLIPSNVYGPGDAGSATAHVVGGLMARISEAKTKGRDRATVWGSGRPRRDFLFINDFVDAVIFCLEHDVGVAPINVGSGRGVAIRILAETIREIAGFEGELAFDSSRPDGMPEKVLDIERIRAMGWEPRTALRAGLETTWAWFETERGIASRAVG